MPLIGLRHILDLEASVFLPAVTAGTLIAAGQLVPVAGDPPVQLPGPYRLRGAPP